MLFFLLACANIDPPELPEATPGADRLLVIVPSGFDDPTVWADGMATKIVDHLAEPERWTDTRGLGAAPLPAVFTGTPRLVEPGETIEIPTPAVEDTLVPAAEVAALVLNVTAVNGEAGGYLQLVGTGASGATHSNVNFGPVAAAANMAIVPLGSGGTISVFSSQRVNVIVDVDRKSVV